VDVHFTVWEDLSHGAVSEDHIIRFIKGCRVPSWILPIGEPFVMNTFLFPWHPLVSDEFRKLFVDNYQLATTATAWQVWVCRHIPNPGNPVM
jgi:hypothetical protein